MAQNQNMISRTAFANFTISNAATTTTATGVAIPAGAIITGIRFVSHDAVTLTGAAATIQLRAGTDTLCDAWAVSDLPAVSVVQTTAATANFVPNGGELNLIEQVSQTSAATGSYDCYVDYLFASDHES